MSAFSYVVARDFGFAPNPFYGVCTLATCKPSIRRGAAVGDWVIGTGAKTRYHMSGRLIYAMRVDETMGFDPYWQDPRFVHKRPVLNGSLKQLYGDNIYHRGRGPWLQENSHHSLDDGRMNRANVARDTGADRVLISLHFVYFGQNAPTIPARFRSFGKEGVDICCRAQGHRVIAGTLETAFTKWLDDRGKWGIQGMPIEFSRIAPKRA